MNKTLSKNRFKTLGKALSKVGIGIDYQVDWSASVGTTIQRTDQPRLGSGNYNGIEGWYFTKDNNINYTIKEKKLIREVLISKGFKSKGISDYEVEFDNDRSYRPNISFILNN
jgi:hypothetical protein|tara:strand:+ start:627 stop:965 length:339 start_codon:yes stop_codon:yes gene_type:complete